MSGPGEYDSVEKLMNAVNTYVTSFGGRKSAYTGFKIEVYIGRGCHKFKLNDQLGDTEKEINQLEKQLEEAKKKLAELKSAKRPRCSSEEHEYRGD